MPSPQQLLLIIVFIPLGLVLINRLRSDTAALLIAAMLGTAQFLGVPILGPAGAPMDAIKAVSGFGQPIVITLISLFVITHGLEQSGITYWIAKKLIVWGGHSENRMIFLLATITAVLSLFMNNLAACVLVLPGAIEVSRQAKVSPSKLLIPVAYGSLLGGVATYFTTANIIVSDLLQIATPSQQPLHIFDFTPVGGLIAVAGIIFLSLWGKKLLPNHEPSTEQQMVKLTGSELEDIYGLGERLWEGRVRDDAEIAGKTIEQACIGQELGVEVTAILRGRQAIYPPSASQVIQPCDTLLLVGREEKVAQLKNQGLSICQESGNGHLSPYGMTLFEILLSPRSKARGMTLKELNFRRQYGFTVVAIRRLDRSYRTDVGEIPLALGDSLLVFGPPGRVQSLEKSSDLIVLQTSPFDQPVKIRLALISLGVVLASIFISIAGFPVYLAMLLGAIALISFGVVNMEEAYQAIEWHAIFLIAGMYAVSLAMVQTGVASQLGDGMVRITSIFGPLGLGAGAYLLTALLTQVMGGQVTALVTGPVAISAAIHIGANPQAIAIATAIGCSASFLTPIAHPVNILVMTPGSYTFQDFFRIGWRLTLISFVMLLIGLAVFWKL